MRRLVIGAVVVLAQALALAGCGPGVPANPTWFQDVQPIVQANCARCHGPDPKVPLIALFRLDRYVKGDDQTSDAWDYKAEIVRQAAANPLGSPPMPPDFPLSDRQRAILRKWVDQGAPKGDRDNTPPRIELLSPSTQPASVDQTLDLTVRSWDDDGDGLWVTIFARPTGGGNELPLAPHFGQGLRSIAADMGVLPSGLRYDIYAALDDGFSDEPWMNRSDAVLLGSLLVDHGAKGTAPVVTLVSPNGGSTLLGKTTIAWTATDADPGDTASLSIDLDLYRYDGTAWVLAENIASALPNGPPSFQWTPDVPAVDVANNNAVIAYKVRVTARDLAGNTRFDESDASFSVAPPPQTTTLTWADVKPVFATYCLNCHGEPSRYPALDYFRLDKYDASDPVPPINTDEGVYEMRATIYQKLIVDGSMPPSTQPQPTSTERKTVKDWLLGGAPEGGTPVNQPPAVTWSTPNDTAVSPTSGGTIALAWSAVDPEGSPVTGGIAFVMNPARSDQLATCSASLTGWTAMPGVSVASGSAVFTRPTCPPQPQGLSCYWCFKATASDGNSTTVKVAAKPVK